MILAATFHRAKSARVADTSKAALCLDVRSANSQSGFILPSANVHFSWVYQLSARDRAFSKLDRDSLQEAIESNNDWAKEWVRKREGKLSYLDEAVSRELVREAGDALMTLSSKLDHLTQEDLVKVLWDIIGALSVWNQMLKRPVNVKVAADLITKELESGLDKLASAGVWTRRAIEH